MIVLVLAAGGALYAWTHFPRDHTSRTSASDALHAFRQRLKNIPLHSNQNFNLPQPGVYRYATLGGEALDTPILSTNHEYDGVSTITVQPSPCGIDERWQVFKSRWNEGTVCYESHGTRLASVTERHEFFGTSSSVSDRCNGGTVPPFSDMRVGMHWKTTCASRANLTLNRSTVVGFQAIAVTGEELNAVHIKSVATLEGETSGRVERNDWRRKADGLVLRRTVTTDAHFDFVGGGHYSEHYSLMLLSSTPRR